MSYAEKQTHNKQNAIHKKHETKDWTNKVHEHISSSVYSTAAWFDSFFVTGNNKNPKKKPQASLRIKLGWEPKATDWQELGARFKIKIKLPNLQNKVDLIFSDDSEDDISNLPLESLNRQSELTDNKFSAAINLTHKKKNDIITDTRVGLRSGDIFFRARHQRTYHFNQKHHLLIEPALYYFIEEKLDARLRFGYRYDIDEDKQFRTDLSFRSKEKSNGTTWRNGYYYLNHITDEQASIVGLLIEGEHNGSRGTFVSNYTASYRYRFNAFKTWLYFEIEPFIEFPEVREYKRTPGLALRVEGYFSKN